MSEMLGNQYFIARNYEKAAKELEPALAKNPSSKIIRRKLVICFIEIGQIDKALAMFISLINDDIDFIIDTDPVADDCPCSELIAEREKSGYELPDDYQSQLKLAMLWLYCDIERSKYHFQKALDLASNKEMLFKVLDKINESQKKRMGNTYSQSSKPH